LGHWKDLIVLHHSTNEGRPTMATDRSILVADVLKALEKHNDDRKLVADEFPVLTDDDVHAVLCWRELMRDIGRIPA
jgi:uncharacterized protein (DUF433 family)